MIFNTTHANKEIETSINGLVGKAYSFFEAIKRKGVGSKRMMIAEVSQGFKNVMNF